MNKDNHVNIKPSRMYAETKTWNPFKGCGFGCSYCVPSFQAQAKRQKQNCSNCYKFIPHKHPERLPKIPNAPTVFVAGNGDISFCDPAFVRQIIAAIVKKNLKRPNQVYYFQTKRPEYLAQFIGEFPPNVILVTTLETNRDEGYGAVSKAPYPSKRHAQFKQLDWPHKVVTVEPAMDFDLDVFSEWLISLKPEYVWLGFNSRPKSVSLPEPSKEKMLALAGRLKKAGIEVRGKELWGLDLEQAVQNEGKLKSLYSEEIRAAIRDARRSLGAYRKSLETLIGLVEPLPTITYGRKTLDLSVAVRNLRANAFNAVGGIEFITESMGEYGPRGDRQ